MRASLLCLVCFFLASSVSADTDFANGDFASSLTSWTVSGGASWSSVQGVTALGSALLSQNCAIEVSIAQTVSFGVATLRFYAFGYQSSEGLLKVYIDGRDWATFHLRDGWSSYIINLRLPVAFHEVKFVTPLVPCAAVGVYIDDVTLRAVLTDGLTVSPDFVVIPFFAVASYMWDNDFFRNLIVFVVAWSSVMFFGGAISRGLLGAFTHIGWGVREGWAALRRRWSPSEDSASDSSEFGVVSDDERPDDGADA